MPAATASTAPPLPPISTAAIVDPEGRLTTIGLNIIQQIWSAAFGDGGLINQVPRPGDLKPIAGDTVSTGWLLCDGTAYNDSQFISLFDEIGVTWGTAGPGTFRVPNLKGNFIIGADGTHALGATGGALSRVIAKANLPSYALTVTDPGHTHTVTDPGHVHTITDPGHTHTGGSTATTTNTAGAAAGTSTSSNTGSNTTGITVNSATTGVTNNANTTGVTVASGGSGTALDTTPAFAAVNWLIKT